VFKKLAVIGGLVGWANSPMGKQAIARVKAYAADPRTRQQAADLLNKVRGKDG